MAVRRGEAPKRFRASVELKTAAERLTFNVQYVNLKTSEYTSLVEAGLSLAEMLVQLVAEWDADYPLSVDGFAELEDERPGCCAGLLEGWHRGRLAQREGN
ncbi:hypothetical protein [Stenotrophomonas phage BUCT603]|nr:hypothetical protein [Stenotrophomonas phage BUCT603]